MQKQNLYLFLGIFLGIACLCIFVSTKLANLQASLQIKMDNISREVGRFQVFSAPQLLFTQSKFPERHFLLDTKTGRIWQQYCGEVTKDNNCIGTTYLEVQVPGITPLFSN